MEPHEAMVLGAIKHGIGKFEKIQKTVGIEPKELDSILRRLEESGFIKVEEKKGWLGAKVEIVPTDAGAREIERHVGELEARWGKMAALYKTGGKDGLKQAMDENKSFIPMMMFFGVMDMAMFGMMFGLIGAAMTDYVPADSMPPGAGDADPGAGDFDFDVGF
ncbi:MAG: hypothetical protein EB829_05035 [Nitrosopumilus sp. H8]|nr:MAG: hypothetical protein EB830_01415 [Nitrosopumilus sp. H13]RNJ78291.1 MAG: hypothetical protein EB829_05035 [Nitrosopumilus sp. H8]